MERTSVPRGKRPRVQVSVDDKERAIARIRKGETKAGISRELGVPESTVRGWVKRADQRLAREACEANESESPPSLAMQSLKLPVKRDHSGQQMLPPMTPNPTMIPATPTIPTIPTTSVAVPMPMQLFQQAADSQLQLNGWLHIFNAGILNFTLIATAAFLRARMRGTTDRQSLWQIICEYVDEAGRNVAANGGQYVVPATAINRKLINSPAPMRNNGFVAPRLHITAEDDEDEEVTT
ncbi:protein distal antenna-related [Drosophila innubila]|uniref:protein distal antenna-related n=1 Tax=Drosophila innubila TaxID=198719 RepID=UPI00148E54D3|nr:protein distal antenna-related [Drosophila innubila]